MPQPVRRSLRAAWNQIQRELRYRREEKASWPDELKKVDDFKQLGGLRLAQAASIEELQEQAAQIPIHGFNGQVIRLACCQWLYNEFGCTSFVETGTRWGHTTITARCLFGGPVFSVELKGRNYRHARRLARQVLGSLDGLTLRRDDSRKALRHWLASDLLGPVPMIYLDAHFYEDHPLVEEVECIMKRGNCVVVIDDFKVPHDLGFGWDMKKGGEVALERISSTLPADRVQVFFPGYAARDETGSARGMCILLVDKRLGLESQAQFPGTLLREEVLA